MLKMWKQMPCHATFKPWSTPGFNSKLFIIQSLLKWLFVMTSVWSMILSSRQLYSYPSLCICWSQFWEYKLVDKSSVERECQLPTAIRYKNKPKITLRTNSLLACPASTAASAWIHYYKGHLIQISAFYLRIRIRREVCIWCKLFVYFLTQPPHTNISIYL